MTRPVSPRARAAVRALLRLRHHCHGDLQLLAVVLALLRSDLGIVLAPK